MNLEKLRKIIDEYKNKFIIKGNNPWKFTINKLLFKEINNKYSNLFKNTTELIYLIKNYDNLENLHIFCYCGNKNNFKNMNKGYYKYCSLKCCTNDNNYQEKQKQTKLNAIDENGLNSYDRQKIKFKQTMLNNYNVDHNWKLQTFKNYMKLNKNKFNEKLKQTKKLKYNDENYNNSIKQKQTKLNNIDENGLNSYQRAILKIKQTKKQRYNNENYNNREKAIQTSIVKYGVKHNWSSKDSKLNGSKVRLEKYGVKSFWSSQQFKDLFKNKEWLNKKLQKSYNTKKKNHTFNTSQQEEKCYQLLLNKFSKDNIERQYKNRAI